jgi:peptidoglycan/LPS O-acetylase OafA/YrhL
MIEATRYALALLVAWTHLWSSPIGWVGWQSVFAFYTLSGYLMARVLQERYGFSLLGMGAFAVNRVLRPLERHNFLTRGRDGGVR